MRSPLGVRRSDADDDVIDLQPCAELRADRRRAPATTPAGRTRRPGVVDSVSVRSSSRPSARYSSAGRACHRQHRERRRLDQRRRCGRAACGVRHVRRTAASLGMRRARRAMRGARSHAAIAIARRSRALAGRSAGSSCRHAATIAAKQAGTSPVDVSIVRGAIVACETAIAIALSPGHGRVPVASSNSITPSENRSARASISRPASCSGAM